MYKVRDGKVSLGKNKPLLYSCSNFSPITFKHMAHLQLGPLYATDAPHRVAPGQFCAKYQLCFCQLVGTIRVDLLLHLLPA